MYLTDRIRTGYLHRLDELIAEGLAIPFTSHSRWTGGNFLTGESHYQDYQLVSLSEWVAWRTSCVAVLDQVVRAESVLRPSVIGFVDLDNKPSTRERAVGFLKAVRRELEAGSLNSLTVAIEAELLADYLCQAETLLADQAQSFTFAAAAVVAGAALERSLRSICDGLTPPEPIHDAKGGQLALNGLVEALKRRQVFNELQAKELRAWSALRNHAAHGQFDEFSRDQVDAMLQGVRRFMTAYVR